MAAGLKKRALRGAQREPHGNAKSRCGWVVFGEMAEVEMNRGWIFNESFCIRLQTSSVATVKPIIV